MKEIRDTTVLNPYVEGLLRYLEQLANEGNGANLEFMKSILSLVADLAVLYGKTIRQVLELGFVSRTIEALNNSSQKEHKRVARWAKKTIDKTLNN